MLLLSICLDIHSLNFISLYPSSGTNFLKSKSYLVAEKNVYKHCIDVCNDIILLSQFIEVVWQHILGVMGNVIHCFVANLRVFPAMKEF